MTLFTNLVRRPLRGAAVTALAAVALTGCDTDELLSVPDVDRVTPGSVADSSALPAVRAAAIGDFAVAYAGSGGNEGQILQSGLLADEYYHSGTFPTRRQVDQRSVLASNGTNQTVYRLLHRSRQSADQAADLYEQFAPAAAARAEVLSLSGFAYTLFGENWCSGVPFSDVDASGAFVYGDPIATDSMFNLAAARFNEALQIATTAADDRITNLARIGLGRALLNLGRYAEAAQAVAAVPTDFRYEVEHSANTARQNNGQWAFSNNQGRWSVANNQGLNGLPFRDAFDAGDTRVPYLLVGRGQDTQVPRYTQQKYPTNATNTPVATGVEARLIEAEAALQAGNVAGFLGIHNALRANTALYGCPVGFAACVNRTTALPDLVDPGTLEGRVNVHFQERAYWLFQTSHRLGDLRRLIRQYGRTAESVFPTGEYNRPAVGGGVIANESYGTDVSLIIPLDERQNPRFVAAYPGESQTCDPTIP